MITITEADESLDRYGMGTLEITARTLISEDDLDVVRDALEPGTSAAVIVYEHTWARRVATAAANAGGEVALLVRIPRETVEAAVLAAAND
jgi:hypothetical protein